LLYEDVITDEANKIRKNLGKLINENYKLMKGYQFKLRKGIMIIRTLLKLSSSTIKNKNNNIDNSDLQIFLRQTKIPKTSTNVINDIVPGFYIYKDFNCNYYKKINLNLEGIINKNITSNNDESKLKKQRETNIVELSTTRNFILNNKKKLKNKNKFVRSNLLELDINKNDLVKKQFQIIQTIKYQYLTSKRKLSERTNIKKYSYTGNRKFTFPGKFIKISCSEVYIIKNQEIKISKVLKRVYFKVFIIFIIYSVIIFYLMILIQNILTKYGNNFFELCILPFVSTLLMEYLISFNFMMFITSLILYNFGEYFINNKKLPLHLYCISKIFINPIVMNHYYAIKLYHYLH